MEHVSFISTSTIHLPPTDQDQFSSKIELTPWDLQLLLISYIQRGLLFHKPKPESNFVQHLKNTLSRTLEIFYPLAGRLVMVKNAAHAETASFFIDCNNAGALFSHAISDHITVDDILKPVYVPNDVIYSFFSLNNVLNFEGVSKPLLAVQVTELVDGIFIGCTVNHCVVDGRSFWHFFNTWSQISRSSNDVVYPPSFPVFGREYLNGVFDLPFQIPFSYNEVCDQFIPPAPPLKQRVFHFSKQKIAQLKAKANDMSSNKSISSLQAILAHLWISITRNRRLNADQEVSYTLPVGLRQRIKPPLSENYLGNAFLIGTARCTAGELLQGGLGFAALQINKMIGSLTEEDKLMIFLEDWAKNLEVIKRNGGFMQGNTKLVTGSSHRFDVYGNDFGWGKPLAVRGGTGNKFDGRLTASEGKEDGSIDFEACLSPETLEAMVSDAEFMEYI